MEECTEIAILLDFYGQLLTSRQYEILDLHYNSDFSLGEIAGQLNISRQGVYDGVKKGKEALHQFEEKLGLVKRFSKQEQTLRFVLENLQGIQPEKSDRPYGISIVLHQCIEELRKVINDL
ncbi:MAG: hypothetical protein KBA53_13580 [Thermoclostridium sp.]|nr:hypothetical protein [Thermoclostridium sp.]